MRNLSSSEKKAPADKIEEERNGWKKKLVKVRRSTTEIWSAESTFFSLQMCFVSVVYCWGTWDVFNVVGVEVQKKAIIGI